MPRAWRVTTTVLPGGKIEVSDPQLPSGVSVDLIILYPEQSDAPRRSILDVLAEAPGGLSFRSAEDVETFLREERESWER